MNKIIIYIVCLATICTKAQVINIPDANFKAKLLEADVTNGIASNIKIDINNDGEIEQSEALLVNFILNLNNSNISDLTGIEYFTNVYYLDATYNNITTANLSGLNHMEWLYIFNNQLTSLNLTGCTALRTMDCGGNQLTQLDFSEFSNLRAVTVAFNQFTSLDFSNNPFFQELGCRNNNLITLNIKNNRQHNFAQSSILFTDCYLENNPNLTTICADAFEVTALQNFLSGCSSQPITITTDCSALNNEEFVSTNLSLAPNPTTGGVFFDNSKTYFKTASVYNYLGQEILSKKLTFTSIENIDLSSFVTGVYIVQLFNDNEGVSLKVIKE